MRMTSINASTSRPCPAPPQEARNQEARNDQRSGLAERGEQSRDRDQGRPVPGVNRLVELPGRALPPPNRSIDEPEAASAASASE